MFEWTQPARIESTYGTLQLNGQVASDPAIRCLKKADGVTRNIRATKDAVPQGDGDILHRRFANGTEMRFDVVYWENVDELACEATARALAEDLAKHLNAILNGAGRFFWQPSPPAGGPTPDERLLDNIRWLVPLTHTWDALERPIGHFGIDSPWPYFIDKTEDQIEVADGATVTIQNDGNTEQMPVIYAHGPTSDFVIENETTGLQIAYDSSAPGGVAIGSGDIGEIDVFKQTMYLGVGGPPGDGAQLKAGVSPLLTDYFALLPGDNEVTVSGADITVLQNNAWVPA